MARPPMPHVDRRIPGAQSEGHISEQTYRLAADAFDKGARDGAGGLRALQELLRKAEEEEARTRKRDLMRGRVRLIGADGRTPRSA